MTSVGPHIIIQNCITVCLCHMLQPKELYIINMRFWYLNFSHGKPIYSSMLHNVYSTVSL